MTISSTTQKARIGASDATPSEPVTLKVAQVGFTGSDDDRERWLAARIWLERDNPDFCQNGYNRRFIQHDAIDLRSAPPRDFLSEQHCYDIVITHNLWGMPTFGPDVSAGPTACSLLHSPSAWKQRLQASGAQCIFMFGADFNAADLDGALSGYECLTVPFRSPMSVFVLGSRANCQAQPISSTDMSMARLAALPELLMNKVLDLSYTGVGSRHLEKVRAMPNLEELRLVGTPVSDGEMVHIVHATELKILVLDNSHISNVSLRLLQKLKRLECLSLNHTKIDDEGVVQLRELSGLKWLSLIETGITDDGLNSLNALSSLEWLCLVNTKVTASGIAKIRRALPQCSVSCNVE